MSMQTSLYPQDVTGKASTNLVGAPSPELYTVSPASGPNANYIIPDAAPFFGASIKVYAVVGTTQTLLVEGVDYALILRYISASYAIGSPIYGGIALLNSAFSGQIGLTYQTLGGNWGAPSVQTAMTLINDLYNPMTVSWDQISGIPTLFPPQPHQNSSADFTGFAQVITAINGLQQAIVTAASDPNNVQGQLSAHLNSPTAHSPAQVGLGNVSNYAVATDQQAIQGTSTNTYMTPFLVSQAIANMNSLAASKWTSNLQVNLIGAVTGSVSFVGSEGSVTLATSVGNITWGSLTGVPLDLLSGQLNISRIPSLPATILISGTTITAGVNVANAAAGSNNPVPLNQLQNYSIGLNVSSILLGTATDNVTLYEVPAGANNSGFNFGVRAGSNAAYQYLEFTGTNTTNSQGATTIAAGTLMVNNGGLPILPSTAGNQALRTDQIQNGSISGLFNTLTANNNLFVGRSSFVSGSAAGATIQYVGSTTQYGLTLIPVNDITTAIQFLNSAGAFVGSISQTASVAVFNGNVSAPGYINSSLAAGEAHSGVQYTGAGASNLYMYANSNGAGLYLTSSGWTDFIVNHSVATNLTTGFFDLITAVSGTTTITNNTIIDGTLMVDAGNAVGATTALFTNGNSDANFRLGFKNGIGTTGDSEQAALSFQYAGQGEIASIGFWRGMSANALAMTFNLNGKEVARFDGTANNFLVGTTSNSYNAKSVINTGGSNAPVLVITGNTTAGTTNDFLAVRTGTGNGAIGMDANIGLWNSTTGTGITMQQTNGNLHFFANGGSGWTGTITVDAVGNFFTAGAVTAGSFSSPGNASFGSLNVSSATIGVGNGVGSVVFASNAGGAAGGFIEWNPTGSNPNQLNLTGPTGTALAVLSLNAATVTVSGGMSVNGGNLTVINSVIAGGFSTSGSVTATQGFNGNLNGNAASANVASLANLAVAMPWSGLSNVPTGISSFAVNLNQNLTTASTPTFAGVNSNGPITSVAGANGIAEAHVGAYYSGGVNPNVYLYSNPGAAGIYCTTSGWAASLIAHSTSTNLTTGYLDAIASPSGSLIISNNTTLNGNFTINGVGGNAGIFVTGNSYNASLELTNTVTPGTVMPNGLTAYGGRTFVISSTYEGQLTFWDSHALLGPGGVSSANGSVCLLYSPVTTTQVIGGTTLNDYGSWTTQHINPSLYNATSNPYGIGNNVLDDGHGNMFIDGALLISKGINVGNNAGFINFVSNPGAAGGAFMEWFPAAGVTNILNISSAGGNDLTSFNVNAFTTNLSGTLSTGGDISTLGRVKSAGTRTVVSLWSFTGNVGNVIDVIVDYAGGASYTNFANGDGTYVWEVIWNSTGSTNSYYQGSTVPLASMTGMGQAPSSWFAPSNSEQWLMSTNGIYGSYGEYCSLYWQNDGYGSNKHVQLHTHSNTGTTGYNPAGAAISGTLTLYRVG